MTEPIILFVGEAPGPSEDKKGIPFVGQDGDLFVKILWAAEISSEHIFVTNILKCKPPGNRAPQFFESSDPVALPDGPDCLAQALFRGNLGRSVKSCATRHHAVHGKPEG